MKAIADNADKALADKVKPLMDEVKANNERITELRATAKDGQPLPAEESKQIDDLQAANNSRREEQTKIVADYAAGVAEVGQLIDLALLGNGMLHGADLQRFISRSLSIWAKVKTANNPHSRLLAGLHILAQFANFGLGFSRPITCRK